MVTHFIKKKDVRDELKRLFKKPNFQAPELKEIKSHNPSLLGNAIDFYINVSFISAHSIETDTVLEEVERLIETWKDNEQSFFCYKNGGHYWHEGKSCYASIAAKYKNKFLYDFEIRQRRLESIVWCYSKAELAGHLEDSLKHYKKYRIDGKITNNFLKAIIVFAQILPGASFIVTFASNAGHPNRKDVIALRKLIHEIPLNFFKANQVIAKPSMCFQSISGRPDYLVDDMILDIKNTKTFFSLDHYFQMVCYYLLYRIDKRNWTKKGIKINRIGIYYSLYGFLLEFNVDTIFEVKNIKEAIQYIKCDPNDYIPFQ